MIWRQQLGTSRTYSLIYIQFLMARCFTSTLCSSLQYSLRRAGFKILELSCCTFFLDNKFCSLSTICPFGCLLVSYLPGSQSCQLCCSPCICHPLWNILCCLLLWVVFHSSFCPGADELWHYEYGEYSQHPQVLLCCSYGIPHLVPHKPNIHISLWYSDYRFFWPTDDNYTEDHNTCMPTT